MVTPHPVPAPSRPLLAALPSVGRERVLAVARRRSFADGEVVVREGDDGSSLYLLEHGTAWVRVTSPTGHRIALTLMGPGEVFGEVGVALDRHVRTATVEALGRVVVLVVRKDDADRLRRTHPEAGDFLLQVLAHRVDRLSRQLLEAHTVPAEVRVARRLVETARLFRAPDGAPVVLPFTQEDVADLAGTTRPTANQALKRLEAAGVLHLARGRIHLLDVPRLRAAAR